MRNTLLLVNTSYLQISGSNISWNLTLRIALDKWNIKMTSRMWSNNFCLWKNSRGQVDEIIDHHL